MIGANLFHKKMIHKKNSLISVNYFFVNYINDSVRKIILLTEQN